MTETVITIVEVYEKLVAIYEWLEAHTPATGPTENWWYVPFTEYTVLEGLLFTLIVAMFSVWIFRAAWRLFSW